MHILTLIIIISNKKIDFVFFIKFMNYHSYNKEMIKIFSHYEHNHYVIEYSYYV